MSVASVAALVVLAFTIEEVQLRPVTMQAVDNFDMVKGLYSIPLHVENGVDVPPPEMDFRSSSYYYYKPPNHGLSSHLSGFYKVQHQWNLPVESYHDVTQVWCTGYRGEIEGDNPAHGFWILLFFYNRNPLNHGELHEGVSGAFMVKRTELEFGHHPNIPEILANHHEHLQEVPPGTTYYVAQLDKIVHVIKRRV